MRIAHAAIATPNRCGLYETVRDLAAAERDLSADARIVDPAPNKEHGITGEDRGVPIASMDWGVTADVVVSHSGHDSTPLAKTDQPIIHVSHGRPLSTFMGERGGKAPGLTYQTQRRNHPRYKAAVTFWPEYLSYLRNIWGTKPVHVVPPPCDLDYWTPGESDFDFNGKRGKYNVVMMDPWSREDSSPYHSIHAFCLFRRMVPEARLHMYAWDRNRKGLTGITNLLGVGGGTISGWTSNMRAVLRAADLLITPHRIYTRSIREAMACGTQVVSGRDCHPEEIERFAEKMVERKEHPLPVRELAERLFNPRTSARVFLRICESVLEPAGVC